MSATRSALSPVVVDASVWVARYVPTDTFHAPSASWVRRQLRAKRTLIAPAILFPELAGSLARRLNNSALSLRATRSVLRLRCTQLVPLDSDLSAEAFQLAARLRLRGADSIYVALARRLGVQLISWDREQITRGGAVTPTTPARSAGARPHS